MDLFLTIAAILVIVFMILFFATMIFFPGVFYYLTDHTSSNREDNAQSNQPSESEVKETSGDVT